MKRKRTTGPYPDESLRWVLKKADSGLFEGVEKNWDKGKQTLLDYLTEEDFTSHGLSHCEGIEGKLEELIPSSVKKEMTPIEIFVLLNAVLYHDIGMASKKYPNEPLNVRREYHAERSSSIIKDKYLELGLQDKAIAFRVADVAKGHGTGSIDDLKYISRN